MRCANPKFILRNWMAAKAYEAAEKGDYSEIRRLQLLLSAPYDEQAHAGWGKGSAAAVSDTQQQRYCASQAGAEGWERESPHAAVTW